MERAREIKGEAHLLSLPYETEPGKGRGLLPQHLERQGWKLMPGKVGKWLPSGWGAAGAPGVSRNNKCVSVKEEQKKERGASHFFFPSQTHEGSTRGYICSRLYAHTGTHARMWMCISMYMGEGAAEMRRGRGGRLFLGGGGSEGRGKGRGETFCRLAPPMSLSVGSI